MNGTTYEFINTKFLLHLPSKDHSFHKTPAKAGGVRWLYSEQHQKLCYFKPYTAGDPACAVASHQDQLLRSVPLAPLDSAADVVEQRD